MDRNLDKSAKPSINLVLLQQNIPIIFTCILAAFQIWITTDVQTEWWLKHSIETSVKFSPMVSEKFHLVYAGVKWEANTSDAQIWVSQLKALQDFVPLKMPHMHTYHTFYSSNFPCFLCQAKHLKMFIFAVSTSIEIVGHDEHHNPIVITGRVNVTLKGDFGVKQVSLSDNKWRKSYRRESFNYSATRKKAKKDRRQPSEDKWWLQCSAVLRFHICQFDCPHISHAWSNVKYELPCDLPISTSIGSSFTDYS